MSTPNDRFFVRRFFVRRHWATIPGQVDAAAFRPTVHGEVDRTPSLSLDEPATLPRVELAAVSQCSGNARGLFPPRIAGGQ